MTFGKRQLVIGALVVALGAAVYLNWQFADTQSLTVSSESSVTSSKQLGQTTYVNTEVAGEQESPDSEVTQPEKTAGTESDETAATSDTAQSDSSEPNSSEAVMTSARVSRSSEYFEAERKKRAESHEAATEALEEILEAASSSENARQEAVQAAERLANTIKAESDIESAVIAKGFEDCFVSINNDNCSVIVVSGTLDDAGAIVIKDIVSRQANIDFDKITISEAAQ